MVIISVEMAVYQVFQHVEIIWCIESRIHADHIWSPDIYHIIHNIFGKFTDSLPCGMVVDLDNVLCFTLLSLLGEQAAAAEKKCF